MPTKANSSASTADREIIITRDFEAPRELVWEAWTDPRHLDQWWGPNGFKNTTSKFEFKPGGIWRYMMHGPDGRDYPNLITYLEIERPARLVYSHGDDENPEQFQTTVTFEQRGNVTTVTMRALFPTTAARDFVIKEVGAIEGGQQTLEHLGQYLKTMNTADREIRISREFDAPRELVWQAMTDPKHVVNWWGPRGFSTTIEEMDVRPGGVWKHTMRGPDGVKYPNKSLFKEVVKPERIVFSHGGHREDGPGARFLATWSFDELAPKRTRVTIHMVFKDQAERDFVVKEFGAVEGAKQTLERLGEFLAQLQASGNE